MDGESMGAAARFVGLCWVAFVSVWVILAFSVKRTRKHQPLVARALYIGVTAVAALLLNGRIQQFHLSRGVLPHTLAIVLIADFIVFAGLVIAIWARVVLGRNWSARVTLKESHELIRVGPYRLVRHPIYSGLLLMILGTAMLAGQVGGFVASLICFCGFWMKLRQEEILLTKELPGYSEYKAHTKALIPFLF
jgi:protein-S-isoprenylcysteine O-methyltransferase Ste14